MSNNKFELLHDDEVVSIPQTSQRIPVLKNHPIIKFGDLKKALTKVIRNNFLGVNRDSDEKLKWLGEGVDVEILKYGSQGWKKGKIRIKISLEFCPDEPEAEEILASTKQESGYIESPLDEIRRMQ